MAQFIQANQLSGVQGSLGQQSLVSAPEPTTADLAGPVIQAADVAGDIYSQSKAKSIVSEELENVERLGLLRNQVSLGLAVMCLSL